MLEFYQNLPISTGITQGLHNIGNQLDCNGQTGEN